MSDQVWFMVVMCPKPGSSTVHGIEYDKDPYVSGPYDTADEALAEAKLILAPHNIVYLTRALGKVVLPVQVVDMVGGEPVGEVNEEVSEVRQDEADG